jgi:hypothetical protein
MKNEEDQIICKKCEKDIKECECKCDCEMCNGGVFYTEEPAEISFTDIDETENNIEKFN